MKRHLQRCGVLSCALLIVPGMMAELHAQTSIARPDSIVSRDPFVEEDGNVNDQNVAAPGRIEFRAPFLDDSGVVTTPDVLAPPRLEYRDVFIDADGLITRTDVAPTGGLEYREIFLDENGGVIVRNLAPPPGLVFRDPFLDPDGGLTVSSVSGSAPSLHLLQMAGIAPNPFNPGTQVSFRLRDPAEVTIKVLDLKGRLVRTLYQGQLPADLHVLRWDGKDGSGRAAASGLYMFRIQAGGETIQAKGLLVK